MVKLLVSLYQLTTVYNFCSLAAKISCVSLVFVFFRRHISCLEMSIEYIEYIAFILRLISIDSNAHRVPYKGLLVYKFHLSLLGDMQLSCHFEAHQAIFIPSKFALCAKYSHIVDFLGSHQMETAPTSTEVLLRPTLDHSDEPVIYVVFWAPHRMS